MNGKTEATPGTAPDPYGHGYKAGLNGEDPRSCPFDDWKEYDAWQRGHRNGVGLMDALCQTKQ